MTIFKSSLTPPFRWLIKEKHRRPSGKGLTVQKYRRIETDWYIMICLKLSWPFKSAWPCKTARFALSGRSFRFIIGSDFSDFRCQCPVQFPVLVTLDKRCHLVFPVLDDMLCRLQEADRLPYGTLIIFITNGYNSIRAWLDIQQVRKETKKRTGEFPRISQIFFRRKPNFGYSKIRIKPKISKSR